MTAACSTGPCAGKTTTVARLGTFFENLGWKVNASVCARFHCVSQRIVPALSLVVLLSLYPLAN